MQKGQSLAMEAKELKWHDIFVVLFGTILSFTDPITDILTLVEFYRADHKTWFGVGLSFIILPCLFFAVLYGVSSKESGLTEASRVRRFTQVFLFGFNPFSPALVKLQTLIFYLKNFRKLWSGEKIVPSDIGTAADEEAHTLLVYSNLALMYEATLESAPQFVIQLYAMAVQQESVKIVQMVSLPVSFLSLAWASTIADEVFHCEGAYTTIKDAPSVKNKLLLFLTHSFVLSSRLFSIALFTVSYKWWITSVLIFHSTAIVLCDTLWFCSKSDCNAGVIGLSIFFFCLHWLRDDTSTRIQDELTEDRKKELRRMQLFSNVLFLLEDSTMILLFYFSHFPGRTWYSLPVAVCVCSFAVLGAIMRVTHFYLLTKESIEEPDEPL